MCVRQYVDRFGDILVGPPATLDNGVDPAQVAGNRAVGKNCRDEVEIFAGTASVCRPAGDSELDVLAGIERLGVEGEFLVIPVVTRAALWSFALQNPRSRGCGVWVAQVNGYDSRIAGPGEREIARSLRGRLTG